MSLGVNLLPLSRKVCTYDCPYCECGFTRAAPLDTTLSDIAPEGSGLGAVFSRLPEADEVLTALHQRLLEQDQEEPIDTITFAGNGEPTMHPEIELILRESRALRDQLAPRARISVLTNGIRLREASVRTAVLSSDDVEVKLDAGCEATFRGVAAPTIPWSLADLRSLLIELGNRVSVQSCLFQGRIDNTSEADLAGMIQILREARPKRVLVYTLDRAPADPELRLAPRELLAGFVERVKGVGVAAELY
jgi:wyosine [tRNA(Phe)-imidazoG37] synthetase (radical SAM superfamily)